MEVLKSRAAFLSNYEVYSLLREMEAKQLEQTRAHQAIKKEENQEDSYKGPNFVVPEEVAENVRTIQVEMLHYLNGEHLPTSRQSDESVAHLTRGLRKYGLTKAEKLQIVNLCPQTVLDLYVIVEEVETRFEGYMEEILNLVQEKLTEKLPPIAEDSTIEVEPIPEAEEDADQWDGDEADQYMEGDFAEGGDDFEPLAEIDEYVERED